MSQLRALQKFGKNQDGDDSDDETSSMIVYNPSVMKSQNVISGDQINVGHQDIHLGDSGKNVYYYLLAFMILLPCYHYTACSPPPKKKKITLFGRYSIQKLSCLLYLVDAFTFLDGY